MSYAQGALLEPLSVVLHGLSRVKLAIGHGAMICGAGPIGLIALAAARASGAHPIVTTDLEPKRLAFAKEFVPSCQVYQVNTALDDESNATEIRALFGPTEYEAPATILECTGVESRVVTAAHVVRTGDDLMVIGVGKDIMNNLPFMKISLSEVKTCCHTPKHLSND
jgi:L-iditol 2-dehydrogenase